MPSRTGTAAQLVALWPEHGVWPTHCRVGEPSLSACGREYARRLSHGERWQRRGQAVGQRMGRAASQGWGEQGLWQPCRPRRPRRAGALGSRPCRL